MFVHCKQNFGNFSENSKFFQRYSRKYFRHRTGNSFYCRVGEISSLLGKKDIFHNLSGKRSKKSEQISVFVELLPLFMGKISYDLGDLRMFSPF